jgi:hypothetical protein
MEIQLILNAVICVVVCMCIYMRLSVQSDEVLCLHTLNNGVVRAKVLLLLVTETFLPIHTSLS